AVIGVGRDQVTDGRRRGATNPVERVVNGDTDRNQHAVGPVAVRQRARGVDANVVTFDGVIPAISDDAVGAEVPNHEAFDRRVSGVVSNDQAVEGTVVA